MGCFSVIDKGPLDSQVKRADYMISIKMYLHHDELLAFY